MSIPRRALLASPPPFRAVPSAPSWLAATMLVAVLSLAACSPEEGPSAAEAPTSAVPVEMQRFPSPPGSRSMGAMDDAASRLNLPVGPVDEAGDVPVAVVEGRVFRRVSMVSLAARKEDLVEYYQGLFAQGGYTIVFECDGVEACGGTRFVSEVIEAYVTAPGNLPRARTVTNLMQPTSGEFRHFSLVREDAGRTEHIGVTLSRAEEGPIMVMTQQAVAGGGGD